MHDLDRPQILPIAEILSLAMLMIKSNQKSASVLCCALELLEKVITAFESLSEAETTLIFECVSLFKVKGGEKKSTRTSNVADDQIGYVTPDISPKLLQLLVCLCATLDLSAASTSDIHLVIQLLLDLSHAEDSKSGAVAIGGIQLLLMRAFNSIQLPASVQLYPPRRIVRKLALDSCPEFREVFDETQDEVSPTNKSETVSLVVADSLIAGADEYCAGKIANARITEEDFAQFGSSEITQKLFKHFLGLDENLSSPSPSIEQALTSVLCLDILRTVLLDLSTQWNGQEVPVFLGWLRSRFFPFALKALACMSLITLPLSIVLRIIDLTGKLLTTPVIREDKTTIFGLVHCPEETALFVMLLGRQLRLSDVSSAGSRKKQIVANQYLIEFMFGHRATLYSLLCSMLDRTDLTAFVVSNAIMRSITRNLHQLSIILESADPASEEKDASLNLLQSYPSFSSSKTPVIRSSKANSDIIVSQSQGVSQESINEPSCQSQLIFIPYSGLSANEKTFLSTKCSNPQVQEFVLSSSPGHLLHTQYGELNMSIAVANWQRSKQWMAVTGNAKFLKAPESSVVDECTAGVCGLSTSNLDHILNKVRDELFAETFMILSSTLSVVVSVVNHTENTWKVLESKPLGPWISIRRQITEPNAPLYECMQPFGRSILSLGHCLIRSWLFTNHPEFWESIIHAALLCYTCGDCNTPLEVLVDKNLRFLSNRPSVFLLALRLAVHSGGNLRTSHVTTLTKMGFSIIDRRAKVLSCSPIPMVLSATSWQIEDSDLLCSAIASLHNCMKGLCDGCSPNELPLELLEIRDSLKRQSSFFMSVSSEDEEGSVSNLELIYALCWPRLFSILFPDVSSDHLLSPCLRGSAQTSNFQDDASIQEGWLLYQSNLCVNEIVSRDSISIELLEHFWNCGLQLKAMENGGIQLMQLLCSGTQDIAKKVHLTESSHHLVEILLNLIALVAVEFSSSPKFIEQALELYGDFGVSTPNMSAWHQAFWDTAAVMLAVACHLVSKSGFGLYSADQSTNEQELIVIKSHSEPQRELEEPRIAIAAFSLVEKLIRDHGGLSLFPTSSVNIISRCLLCLSHILGAKDASISTEKDLIPLKSISLIWQACDSLVSPASPDKYIDCQAVSVGGERFMLVGRSRISPETRSRWPLDVCLRSVIEDPEHLLYRMAGELTKLASDERVAVRISAIKSLSTMLALRARTWSPEKWTEFFVNLYKPIISNAHEQRIACLQRQVNVVLDMSENLPSTTLEDWRDTVFTEIQELTDAWDETLRFCVETGLPRIDVRIIDCVLYNEQQSIAFFYPHTFKLLEAEGRLRMKHQQRGVDASPSSAQRVEEEKLRLKKLSAIVTKLIAFIAAKQCATFSRCIKWMLRWSMLPNMERNKCSMATGQLLRTVCSERLKFDRTTEGSTYIQYSEAAKHVEGTLELLFIDGLCEALSKFGHYLCIEKTQDYSQLDEIVCFKTEASLPASSDSDESVQIFLKLLGSALGINLAHSKDDRDVLELKTETPDPSNGSPSGEIMAASESPRSEAPAYTILQDNSGFWMALTEDCCEPTSFLRLWDDEMSKDLYYEKVHNWQVSNFFTPEESCLLLYQEALDYDMAYTEIDDVRNLHAVKQLGCPSSIVTLSSFICSSRFINGLISNTALTDYFLNKFVFRFIQLNFYKTCCERPKTSALMSFWSQVVLWFLTRFQRDFLQHKLSEDLWLMYREIMLHIQSCLTESLEHLLSVPGALPLCHRILEVLCITLENELCFVYLSPRKKEVQDEVLKHYWDQWQKIFNIMRTIVQSENSSQSSMIGQGRALAIFKVFVESAFLRQADYCLWKMVQRKLLRSNLISEILAFVSRPIHESATNSSKSILRFCGTWNAVLSILHLCDALQSSQLSEEEEEQPENCRKLFEDAWSIISIALTDCVHTLTHCIELEKQKSETGRLSRVVGLLTFGVGRRSKSELDDSSVKDLVQRTVSLLSLLTTVAHWKWRDDVVPEILKIIAELMIVDDRELRLALRSSMLAFL
eukprot:Gregarina_sp_Poly_1__9821@NODE_62_length_16615_cov_49_436669_g53_i0_p1_GENE_NODE_62_length_16615_cov_49_436669_g53_i0NODE_62_length_16615_cov_49_436669_g53_i0_p1_ORF_typecomplete_len2021_score299_58Mon2_C/PF16206_5/0_025_NODE_62_length_16615_cov_49_436669_g53_i01010116163